MTFEANRLSGPRSTTKSQDPPGPPPGRDGLAAHPGLPPPAWKSLLALISLALSLLLWWNGLVESLDRPSVMDSLSLRQLELTALATDALPESLRSGLAGDDPRKALVKELERQFEAAEAPAPVVRRLELELLQRSISPASADQDQLRELMAMVDVPRRPLLKALIAGRPLEPAQRKELLVPWEAPTLVKQLSCEAAGRPTPDLPRRAGRPAAGPAADRCECRAAAPGAGGHRSAGQGTLDSWEKGRASSRTLEGPRLSLVDLILLIAGGFVMLGEVVVPVLLQPPLQALVRGWGLNGPLGQGIQVLVLYLGLMVAPLSILWLMLRQGGSAPTGGWLQWHWIPVLKAIRQALGTLLMVLPVVALAGWGIEQIWGDPGGSNPLLDLVLTSSEPWSLLLFGFTAIVLAPLFEETLFRGVLLPVLGRRLGGGKAVVISAAVFALAHLSLGELIPLFLLGIGLGWLRWRSGRLSCSVWMHGLWNGLTFLNLLVLAD
jgi:membrane protease YdiL (CAAX protease family)